MDPITQQRLAYLLACEEEYTAHFEIETFRPVVPLNASSDPSEIQRSQAEIQQIAACIFPYPRSVPRTDSVNFVNTQTIERCFREVLGGNSVPHLSQLLPRTENVRMVCGGFVGFADSYYRFLDPRRRLIEIYEQTIVPNLSQLDPHEQTFVQGIRTFYEALLTDRETDAFLLDNLRNVPQDLVDRRAAYHFPSDWMESISPSLRPGSRLWTTEYLVVPNFRYRIPVVFPTAQAGRWPTYQRNLRFVFGLFKLFITPRNLERILRPGNGRPDFTFLLAPRAPVSPELLEPFRLTNEEISDMNDDSIGGYAVRPQFGNYIMAREDCMDHHLVNSTGNRPVIANVLPNIFFHEFAHHIDYSSFTDHDHDNLSVLLNWWQRLFETSRGHNFYAPAQRSRNGDARPFALQNTGELFAVIATEWMVYQTERFLGIPHPEDNSLISRHRQARLDLMGQFFSQDGMRREVFELENIEATYRRHGIEVNLDEVAASMLSVETRVAVQQDHSGQLGGEVSVGVRTNSRRHANLSFGLSAGLFSPGRNTYLLGEVGVRSPLARFQIESSVVNGVDLGNGDVLLGIGARLSYFPFDPGFGLNFFGGARVLADTHQGEVRGLFQLGVGYVPRWSF